MREKLRSPAWLLEAFVASNLLVLILDIVIAHSANQFGDPAEWIPLSFSAVGGLALLGILFVKDPRRGLAGVIGEVIGWMAIAVGVAGLLWHLSGEFFQEVELDSLVYSAPFIAPLAYAGLGLLLLLNRRVDADSDPEWGRWVLFLALLGIMGNFGLAVTDHARNGFFDPREWIAVVLAAAGVGGVLVAVLWPGSRSAHLVAWVALGLQVVAGVLGFGLHVTPLFTETSSASLVDRVVYGPPVLAPLLFANMAVPGALGLWGLARGVGPARAGAEQVPRGAA
ncbi:MAG: hypothetical protein PVJ80_02105 [Gemmatimonadota bacterium]|jgi:hypothetical protein